MRFDPPIDDLMRYEAFLDSYFDDDRCECATCGQPMTIVESDWQLAHDCGHDMESPNAWTCCESCAEEWRERNWEFIEEWEQKNDI